MGRNEAFSKDDVLDMLENGEYITKASIAKKLKCTLSTVQTKIKELRELGIVILPNVKGLKLMYEMETKQDEQDVLSAVTFIAGLITGCARIGALTAEHAIIAVRKKSLDEDQLLKASRSLAIIKNIVDTKLIESQIEQSELFDRKLE